MLRIFTDLRCDLHRVPDGFPESPERLRRAVEHLRSCGRELANPGADAAPSRAVARVHDAAYLERFEHAVRDGQPLLDTADNPLSPGTWEAAWAAAATAVEAADWVAAASGRSAFALVRPPGHHAESGAAMGFCYLNNVAVAAEHLLSRHGVERLAIFDFDVHHGNGTQHHFESRGDVLFVSTHQYPFYPGTGGAGERGRGEGEGATLNLPLPAGTGDDAYRAVLEDRVCPALERFEPQVLLLSAGFDAWRHDPLGGVRLEQSTFHHLGERLGGVAAEVADGRVLAVLEGGYDLEALPRLIELHIAGLEGRPYGAGE